SRPLVKHCVHKEDFYALVSLMLGELNASHLGIGGKSAAPEQQTADLGILFDRTYKDHGLKVAEILRGGPADQRGLALAPGDIVLALYSDCFDKEGIVLDVRYNGGGFTHEQVLNYIGGKEHTFFHHRHGGSGLVLNRQDRRWTKPLSLLINNRSYSDAEIFPNAF